MTHKRYLENAYIYNFEATLIKIENFESKLAMILDESYFYPEGGGQLSDQGVIGEYPIVDVQIKDGVIYHITDADNITLKPNTTVVGAINVSRRRHFMQQHAGQHLFSGTAYNLYAVNTIGFHMGEDYVTVDFDKVLDQTSVDCIEYEANKIIQNNLKITSHMPSEEMLNKMPLRKIPKVKENIRVIEIEHFDFSPCGGIHPQMTGEIGLIKVKKIEKYKKGIRVEFICGLKAISYLQQCVTQQNELSKELAKPEFELLDGVKLLKLKAKEDKKEIIHLESTLIDYEIAKHLDPFDLSEQPCFLTIEDQNYPINRLREKINRLLNRNNIALIYLNEVNGTCYIFIGISKNLVDAVPLKTIFEKHKTLLTFRGGGNHTLIQGQTTELDKLDSFVSALSESINHELLQL
jgi:alanyl-tRNA synthetase